jgi:ubiquitin-protein ligase
MSIQDEKQKQKDKELETVLNCILQEVNIFNEENKKVIMNSFLQKFILSKLNGNTLFEIEKHSALYNKIFDILVVIINNYPDYVLKENFEKFYNIIKDIYSEIALAAKMGSQDNLTVKFSLIKSKCDELYDNYQQTKLKEAVLLVETNEMKSNIESKESLEKTYKTLLSKYNFTDKPIITENSKYYFIKEYNYNKNKKVSYHKRIVQEFGILKKSVPIEYGAAIYVNIDPENISVMRVLITGPHDTPYDSGCFIFDVYIPDEFPNKPPLVYMLNTGGMRFNPNLYACGKVCLSILGTWNGAKGETWNKETSSLFQVFMSIQSLILIDEPYFNEPGYESSISTQKGKDFSESYNNRIRYYTMEHAIKNLITNNEYPQFTEVIKEHFKIKKNRILEQCEKWVQEAPLISSGGNKSDQTYSRSAYKKLYDELHETLEKL